MCFNAVHAEMNLSVPVIQPGLLWNPVWGIFAFLMLQNLKFHTNSLH